MKQIDEIPSDITNEIGQKCAKNECNDIGSQEIWKPINGYEGFYEVSNFGRVKRLKRLVNNKAGRKSLIKERMASPAKDSSGYFSIKLTIDNVYKHYKVSRLVATAFIPNPDNLPEVNHKDFNKENNRVENLEWVTASQNVQHAYDNGVMIPKRGELSGRAKFSNEDIIKIREMYIPNVFGYIKVAKIFNTTPSNIMRIVRKERWGHI